MTFLNITLSSDEAKVLIELISEHHYVPFDEGQGCICGEWTDRCTLLQLKHYINDTFGFEGYYG